MTPIFTHLATDLSANLYALAADGTVHRRGTGDIWLPVKLGPEIGAVKQIVPMPAGRLVVLDDTGAVWKRSPVEGSGGAVAWAKME